MAESTTAYWFPVVTLLIGYATKSLTDWFDHKRKSKQEKEAREFIRRDKVIERRTEFQRKTLLEFQDVIIDLARTTGQMQFHDIRTFRATGQWQKQLYPEDLAEANRLAMARISTLGVRIRDAHARELTERLKTHCAQVGATRTENESRNEMTEMTFAFEALSQRIGELLRQLDDFDDQMTESSARS